MVPLIVASCLPIPVHRKEIKMDELDRVARKTAQIWFLFNWAPCPVSLPFRKDLY